MHRYLLAPFVGWALLFGILVGAGPALAGPEESQIQQCGSGGCQEESQTQLARGGLQLRSHEVKVVINNGFATTTVDQVLENQGTSDVEAAWAFPLPKEAALSELSVSAGGQQYIGEVVATQRAHEIYRAEGAAGRTAALAVQHEYFHYQVKISRVPAGGTVMARVVYYQALEIEAGVGRYLYPQSEGKTDDLKRAFWSMDRRTSGKLTFDVTVKTAFPVDQLHSPSHAGMQFSLAGEDSWSAHYEQMSATLDRDFVLLYRLHPDVPARIELLTHREQGASEGTFMAVVTPGSDLAPIQDGTDWAFVLDVSGSMKGEKLRVLKRGVSKALRGLRPLDRFQLITFNERASKLTPGWRSVDPGVLAATESVIDGIAAGGSTNVFAGLEAAYRDLDADRPTGIILVGDGVANVGPHHYRELIGLARKHDVRIFAFAIGNSANTRLLGDLAKDSGGTSASISVQDEIAAQLLLAQDRMTHLALHGVTFNLPGATVVYPKTLPTLYMGQQLVVLGRYDRTGSSKLVVTAKLSGKPVSWEVEVDLPAIEDGNPELERLYALQAITDMQRESWLKTGDAGEARGAIVDMALRYSLVTDYTAMIVVADEQKAQYGIGDANKQRRQKEVAAARQRARNGSRVHVTSQGTPLAGPRAAHAPTRYSQRTRPGGGSRGAGTGGGGGGGGGGSGAVGPFAVLVLAGLAGAALRRRRKKED